MNPRPPQSGEPPQAASLEAADGRERVAGTSRDPVLRRHNRKLGLLLVGICLVMAACGFVYVRWVMMRPVGTP